MDHAKAEQDGLFGPAERRVGPGQGILDQDCALIGEATPLQRLGQLAGDSALRRPLGCCLLAGHPGSRPARRDELHVSMMAHSAGGGQATIVLRVARHNAARVAPEAQASRQDLPACRHQSGEPHRGAVLPNDNCPRGQARPGFQIDSAIRSQEGPEGGQ